MQSTPPFFFVPRKEKQKEKSVSTFLIKTFKKRGKLKVEQVKTKNDNTINHNWLFCK